MKKSYFLIVLVLALAACDNIQKHRNEILELSTDYQVTMENLRGLLQRLSGELEMLSLYQSKLSDHNASAHAAGPSKEATDLELKLSGYNAKIVTIVQDIGKASKELNDQEAELEAMKTALNTDGKYENDYNQTIKTIRTNIDAVNPKIKDWNAQIDAMGKSLKTDYETGAQQVGIPLN